MRGRRFKSGKESAEATRPDQKLNERSKQVVPNLGKEREVENY